MINVSELHAPREAAIDTATLAVLIRSGIPMVVLDARTPEMDEGSRIPTAMSLTTRSTPDEVEKIIRSKRSLIVTYCTNLHCPVSVRLAAHLKNLGYENVLHYPDGLAGWIAAGYPVEKSHQNRLAAAPQPAPVHR